MLGTLKVKRLFTVGAALAMTSVSLSGCAATSGDFTVLSYNVAGLPQEFSGENPDANIPLISPLLDDYDVVLTQEDFDWWDPLLDGLSFARYHEQLRAQATHPHRSARWPGPAAAGIDPAVRPAPFVGDGLGVLSRPEFAGETRVAWRDCFGAADTSDGGAADCLAGKGFSVVRMTLAPDLTVDVYNLHGEAGGTDLDQQLQEDDFVQLAAYIQSHSAGRAVILAGDTNLHTNSDHPDGHNGADTRAWAQFLGATGLTDACVAVGCPDVSSIDKVAFRSGGGVTLTATSHDFPRARFRDPQGNDLSDHPPLVVGFHWQKT
ncbi:MAG TPA: endonuclease/exonuclease/phosphatase family protein [Acidimicrobiales bacterium]|nr:endonuclease/exonuclease/phosphatase family protein [Acidimicrobiales bacterium]